MMRYYRRAFTTLMCFSFRCDAYLSPRYNLNSQSAIRWDENKDLKWRTSAAYLHRTTYSEKSFRKVITQTSAMNTSENKHRKPHFVRILPLMRIVAEPFSGMHGGTAKDEDTIMTAGIFINIKKLHNPVTYIVLSLLAGFKWNWCFKSPLYWFAVGFCIKWYRARYVFKIPVWDRQPNWNNIITSKEQEKDLKAYTCKNCGSTLFIAKTREFFFEGDTGFGGLGCFSCGAKGRDNFIMDRDRIVEDVGDMDDYFEYERPLDFVSRAERRKLLKEAQGDETKANQLLVERTSSISENSSDLKTDDEAIDVVIEADQNHANKDENVGSTPLMQDPNSSIIESESIETKTHEFPSDVKSKPDITDNSASSDLDGLGALDMDA